MKQLNHDMILSASGWRKVFAISNTENDSTKNISNDNKLISVMSSFVFAEFIKSRTQNQNPKIVVGFDTRPTGPEIANEILKGLIIQNCKPIFIGITAAPEIMAYSKSFDGFIYISASHNPIGHNGIKFGLNDGGVLCAQDNSILIENFKTHCTDSEYLELLQKLVDLNFDNDEFIYKDFSITKNSLLEQLDLLYNNSESLKNDALKSYFNFSKSVISAIDEKIMQDDFFTKLSSSIKKNPIGIVCDFNGSARTLSIDKTFFEENNINFYPFNDHPGQIIHEIIPEPENLIHVAKKMEELQAQGKTDAVLGYMPDCDGDRGNIVYFDKISKSAKILKAQEVFSLSVLAELAFSYWLNGDDKNYKPAVAVNCPTSMRIDKIASYFGAKVFRGEVGEANIVNTARLARKQGYTVRILGEGSNGGTITFPSNVRDPINTIFAFVKLLTIKDDVDASGKTKDGLFHIWCKLSNQENNYKENFTLSDIIQTLPIYTTTGVSEPRAILKIKTTDHALLKLNFQKAFESSFKTGANGLLKKYNITDYRCVITNGTQETYDVTDFSQSKNGGLKIQLFENNNKTTPTAFIWMRGSGTEPVFRIMCDVKGSDFQKEKDLLQWETELLLEADK